MLPLPLAATETPANPCGGLGWATRPNHEIVLETGSAPRYEPGTGRYLLCEQTWQNFHCELADAALRHALPISWVLAIACVETGPWSSSRAHQAAMESPAGALGVMQIMPATAEALGYAPQEMLEPAKNIDAGARLISQIAARVGGGLPAICGPYNSGQLCCDSPGCRAGCQNDYRICTAGDYPGAALRYNNTAVRYLRLVPCSRFGTALGFALIAVGIGGAVKWSDRQH